jgi:phenylacetate-CoA ligase
MNVAERLECRLRDMAGMSGALTGSRRRRLESTAAIAVVSRHERKVPYWPTDRLLELQQRRLRTVVAHAAATVPFYRAVMADLGIRAGTVQATDLARLPTIDGGDLAHDPMRFVSEPFRKSGREVFKTSGSTSGLRKPIFWDHPSLLLRAARGERDRVVISQLAGEPWREVIVREFLTNEWRHSLARWAGITTEDHQRLLILPADFSSRTQRTIYSERTIIPRRPVHYQHLPPAVPFAVAVAHLRALRPRVIFSFGSYVDQFLHFVDAAGLDVPLPRVWVYLGDRISPGGRDLAARMGCALYSVYGAMEAGTIGFQCERRDGFHLNVDLCAVRVVDDEGRDLPAGEIGHIVISPLDNRAMVLLNYRLGDRGALATEPCSCGRTLPVLARMEGRRSEIVRLADGRELSSLAIEAGFGAELRRAVQAQLMQPATGRLRWRIVPAAGVDPHELEQALVSRGRQVLGPDTPLDVEFTEHIPLTSAGKFLRVVAGPPGSGADRQQ